MKVSFDFGLAKVPETGAMIQPEHAIPPDRAAGILQGITSAIGQMGKEVENIIEVIIVVAGWGNCADFRVVFAVEDVPHANKKTKFEGLCSHRLECPSEEDALFVRAKIIGVVEGTLLNKMNSLGTSRNSLASLRKQILLSGQKT